MKRKAQASLEMTMAIISMLLLTLASFKIFFWLSSRLVMRHKYYQATRDDAGRQTQEQAKRGNPIWRDPVRVNPDNPDDPRRLNIFK